VSPTSITFYTYSGSGTAGDVPYKVRLFTTTSGTKTYIKSRTWAPTTYKDEWSGWPSSPDTLPYVERTLLTVPSTALTPLKVSVSTCNRNEGVDCSNPENRILDATPASGPLVLAAGWVPDTVTISLGDQNEPKYVVRQQILLVNSIALVNAP
jgi:hypothetical protein